MPNPPTINGMNSAAHALRYWERKQDVVANNLANVSTDGFKAQHVFGKLIDGMSPLAQATSDLSTGNLHDTGNPNDLAIRGDGFLLVKAENGERYTRGGSFRIDEKHQLVNADGLPLLGEKDRSSSATARSRSERTVKSRRAARWSTSSAWRWPRKALSSSVKATHSGFLPRLVR